MRDSDEHPLGHRDALGPAVGSTAGLSDHTHSESLSLTRAVRRVWRNLQRLENQSPIGQWVVSQARANVDRVIRHRPVGTILDFADAVIARKSQLAADIVVSCDVTALTAAHLLATDRSERIVCDIREVPDLGARSLPKAISPTDLHFINSAIRQQLRDCSHLMTVGPALGSLIVDQIGVAPVVVPNYLPARAPQTDGVLRRLIGIDDLDPLIAVPNTIVAVADSLLQAVAESATPFHVAFIGDTKPAAYKQSLQRLVQDLDIEHRIHWVPPVPYDDLGPLIAGADLGAILLDPDIANHRVAYPNRLFDALSGGLPLVSSPVADVAQVIRDFACGTVAETNSAEHWLTALDHAWTEMEVLRNGVLTAQTTLTWESTKSDIRKVLPEDTGSVTFLHPSNLHRNQRTLRMARLLSQAGTEVRLATVVSGAKPDLGPNISVVPISL